MIKKEFLSIFKSVLKFMAKGCSDWIRDSDLGFLALPGYCFTRAWEKTAQIWQHKSSAFPVAGIIDVFLGVFFLAGELFLHLGCSEWRGKGTVDGAGQVAKTGVQGSASSPAWQALNVVKVQMCDNKNGEK